MTAELTEKITELVKTTNKEILAGQAQRNGWFEIERLHIELGLKALKLGEENLGKTNEPNVPVSKEHVKVSSLDFIIAALVERAVQVNRLVYRMCKEPEDYEKARRQIAYQLGRRINFFVDNS